VGSQRANVRNATVSWPLQPMVVLLRTSGSFRHCPTTMCGTLAVRIARVGLIGNTFETCASFPEPVERHSYRPVFATVSTIHAAVAKPLAAVAIRDTRMPEMSYRRSTSRFRRQAEWSQSGTWAASMRYAIVCCTAGLFATKRFRAGDIVAKIFECESAWLCFGGCADVSDTMAQPLLSLELRRWARTTCRS
jgi:hypothetical protein